MPRRLAHAEGEPSDALGRDPGQGISTETYEQVVRQMLDHQHKIERRQQWWSGVAMCLPVVSSSILTVVMLLTRQGWGATVAPARQVPLLGSSWGVTR